MVSYRKNVLLSASVLAICVAAPVSAQTVPINGGALLPNPLTTVTADTLAGGVTATGASPSAQVVDLSTGETAQISEVAAPAVLNNGGTLTVTASATGTGAATANVGNIAPDVPASGTYQSAISQKHLLGDVEGATWNASATLLNTGSVRVRAIGTSTDGNASATVVGGIAQTASVETKGRTATAVLDNRGIAEVTAAASGAGTVTASVGIGGETGAPAIRQFVFSAKSPDAITTDSGSILNSGTLGIQATATPVAAGTTSTRASLTGGVVQQVQATGRGNSNLTASVVNGGTMNFGAAAGTGTGTAVSSTALATEILTQRVQANGGGLQSDPVTGWNDIATVTLTNNGTINLITGAQATGTATSLIGVKAVPADLGQYGNLYGSVYGEGLNRGYLDFSTPSPILSEHGVISQRGQANGWGNDVSNLTFTNGASAAINVTANASAAGVARNVAAGLIVQKTQANGTGNDTVTAGLTNAGRISITVGSTSTAASGNGLALSAVAHAIQQTAEVTGPTKFAITTGEGGGEPTFGYYTNIGELTFTNAATGLIDIRANATATGGASQAHAYVEPGLLQAGQVDGGTPKASFDNRKTFAVSANSVASGTSAFATAGTANLLVDAGFPVDEGRLPVPADVVGVGQVLIGKATDARFTNSGDLTASASSTATGTSLGATALSSAIGYEVTGEPVGVTATNSGSLAVSATSTASANAGTPRLAKALATGMSLHADYQALPEILELVKDPGSDSGNGQNGHPSGDVEEAPSVPTYRLSGSVTNTGTITAFARSTGDAQLPTGEFTLPASIVPGQVLAVGSTAVGVDFLSASNAMTLQNRGTIEATAITTGATAAAFGIRVKDYENNQDVQALPTDVLTLSNLGGTIRARVSTNNGTAYRHGVAIDTSTAPNKVVINLEGSASGSGLVYGNIDLSADDEIHVRAGETLFDGVVNPGGPAEGSLAIHSGGTLYLVNQPHGAVSTTGTATVNAAYDGPAGAVVNSFAVESGGKLALQLPSFPTGPGTYPTIVANSVALGATSALEIRRSSWNGLYANSYTFNNVIKAPTSAALTGTFAPGLVAFASPTPLLRVEALYNRDTGGGDVDLAISRIGFGAVAGLTVNQAAAGNGIEHVYSPTLTGPFAGLLGNLFLLNDAAYREALTQLGGDQYAGFVQGLRNQSLQANNQVSDHLDCTVAANGLDNCNGRDGQIRIWGQALYNDVSVDSDINAPGYDSKNWSALLGVDYTTGNFTIGAFGGYRDTKLDFTRNGGRIDADGWQLGMMAAYDTGTYYGRIIGSYSDLSGQSLRTVNILTTAGTIIGKPDTAVTSLYGEIGGRIKVGSARITPFAALDYAHVKLKAFSESGVPGANLAFSDQSQDQTSLLAGLKVAGNVGGIIPEAKVAWRYNLSDTPIGVIPRFVDAPAGSEFKVIAPYISRSSFVAGASLSAVLGERFTGRIGYQGRFSDQVKDHAIFGSLVFHFGGSR